MAALLDNLGAYLDQQFPGRYSTEIGDTELLIGVLSSQSRRQPVKVEFKQSRYGEVSLLRLRSRACIARDYQSVSEALQANAEATWCGFALDDSVNPPVIDVIYNMPARNIDSREFAQAVEKVANVASAIGHQTGDSRHFG